MLCLLQSADKNMKSLLHFKKLLLTANFDLVANYIFESSFEMWTHLSIVSYSDVKQICFLTTSENVGLRECQTDWTQQNWVHREIQ